jgi:hypothetical protein
MSPDSAFCSLSFREKLVLPDFTDDLELFIFLEVGGGDCASDANLLLLMLTSMI